MSLNEQGLKSSYLKEFAFWGCLKCLIGFGSTVELDQLLTVTSMKFQRATVLSTLECLHVNFVGEVM